MAAASGSRTIALWLMALAIRKAKPCLAGLWLRLFGSRTLPAQQAGIALWLISLPE